MSKDKRPRYEREQPRIVPPLSDGRLGVCPHCGKQLPCRRGRELAELSLDQRGSVVLSLMLLGALAGLCVGLLSVLGENAEPKPELQLKLPRDPSADPVIDPDIAKAAQRRTLREAQRRAKRTS